MHQHQFDWLAQSHIHIDRKNGWCKSWFFKIKIKKSDFLKFKCDFFYLNQILQFKLIILTYVSHLLGNSNINKIDDIDVYFIKEVKN